MKYKFLIFWTDKSLIYMYVPWTILFLSNACVSLSIKGSRVYFFISFIHIYDKYCLSYIERNN